MQCLLQLRECVLTGFNHFNYWSVLGWWLQICGQNNTLTCAVKTSGVGVPSSTRCAYCGHISNWVKTWVTPEPYLSPLSCVWIWRNGTTPWNSGITTVRWRKKHHVFQPRLENSLLVMVTTCTSTQVASLVISHGYSQGQHNQSNNGYIPLTSFTCMEWNLWPSNMIWNLHHLAYSGACHALVMAKWQHLYAFVLLFRTLWECKPKLYINSCIQH